MNKCLTLSLFLFFIFNTLVAQIDILEDPDLKEKAEITRILSEYEKYLSITGDSTLPKEKKALGTLKFSKEIQNNQVQVYNDLDTSSGKDTFLKFFSYIQGFDKAFSQTVFTSLSNIRFGKVKFDKIRKYHFVEASALKTISWQKLNTTIIRDSLLGKDSLVTDTLKYHIDSRLTFYIRFDKANSLSRNFKLFAISKEGSEPKLEPLPAIVVWWLEMDLEWKSYFRDKLKLDEYPDSWKIEGITSLHELDLTNSSIRNLEPLRKMPFLKKLICTNSQITDLTPLYGAKGLQVLDVTGSQVRSLAGIDSLFMLEELYCPKLQLTSIDPVRNLTSLIKLDCSENDLTDLSPLEKLVNLKELNIALNEELSSAEVVKNLVLLEKLNMSKIRLGNIDMLKGLVNLIELNLYNTNISSLEPLRGHQKIIYLVLDHNKITSLDPIKDFKFLLTLSFSSTNITDISLMSNFPLLKEIDISRNPNILSLGPIQKLEYVRVLKCYYTKIGKEEVARFKKNHPGCDISYW